MAPRTGRGAGPVPWVFLGVASLGALVLRVVYNLTVVAGMHGEGDAYFYHLTANLLADGQGYIDPFRAGRGIVVLTANHPPGWPVVLSVLSRLGITSYDGHRMLGAFTGAFAVFLVGVLATRMAGPTIGKIAVVVAALNPVLIGIDGSLMSESLYGVFLLGAVIVALRVRDEATLPRLVALGVLIALAALTRSEAVLLVVLLAVPAVWLGGGAVLRRLGSVCVVALACVVVIAPWTIRNHGAFGAFVPLTTNDGTLLSGANCDAVYSGHDIGIWRFDCVTIELEVNEAVASNRWRRESARYMADHLDRVPVVVAARVLRTWGLFEPRPDLDEGVPYDIAQYAAWYHWLALVATITGVVVAWRRRIALWPFASIALLVTALSAIGWGVTRFRQPFELVGCVLVALAVHAAWHRVSRRSGTSRASTAR